MVDYEKQFWNEVYKGYNLVKEKFFDKITTESKQLESKATIYSLGKIQDTIRIDIKALNK